MTDKVDRQRLEALIRLQQERDELQAAHQAVGYVCHDQADALAKLTAENSQLREYIAQLQQSLVSCAVQLEPNNEARKQAVQIWQNPPALGSERVQEEKR